MRTLKANSVNKKSRYLVVYHGTSRKNAEKILAEGFKAEDVKRNWDVPSKPGFIYFSTAYSPFYAMRCDEEENEEELAIIKAAIKEEDLYPEDDFIMLSEGKPKYDEEDLARIDYEAVKHKWKESLRFMGNVSAKPEAIKIIGCTFFKGRELIWKCDPVICPDNFKIMGKYYEAMTEWIYQGKSIKDFPTSTKFIYGIEDEEVINMIGGKKGGNLQKKD